MVYQRLPGRGPEPKFTRRIRRHKPPLLARPEFKLKFKSVPLHESARKTIGDHQYVVAAATATMLPILIFLLAMMSLVDQPYKISSGTFIVPWYVSLVWTVVMVACALTWINGYQFGLADFDHKPRTKLSREEILEFTARCLGKLSKLECSGFTEPKGWRQLDKKKLFRDIVNQDFGAYLANPASSLHSGLWGPKYMYNIVMPRLFYVPHPHLYNFHRVCQIYSKDTVTSFIKTGMVMYFCFLVWVLWHELPLAIKRGCEARLGKLALQIRNNCRVGTQSDLEKGKVASDARNQLEKVIREILEDNSDTEEEKAERDRAIIKPITKSIFI